MLDDEKALHLKYRPTKFSQVIGQDHAIQMIKSWDDVPHAVLFSGQSGCGKTTLARILAERIGCKGLDLQELNSSDVRGIETIRRLQQTMNQAPFYGEVRCFVLDECHKMTPDAQEALLKPLEEPPRHVYWMLCTSEPNKLIDAIHSRCTQVKLKSVSATDLQELVGRVAEAERKPQAAEVKDAIVEAAEGSPRKALVILQQVMSLDSDDDKLELISKAEHKQDAIAICRALTQFPKPSWADVSKLVLECEEDAEGIRRLVLVWATKMLLTGKGNASKRAYLIVDRFRESFFYCGKAGLAAACYEVCHTE